MASKYRLITINVSNDELDSLEDFVTEDYDDLKKEESDRKKAFNIWRRLVKEWDK